MGSAWQCCMAALICLRAVINNIALTQKDHFPSQLRIVRILKTWSVLAADQACEQGVRFFDFRPGFCFHDVIRARRGGIHHQVSFRFAAKRFGSPVTLFSMRWSQVRPLLLSRSHGRSSVTDSPLSAGCKYVDFLTHVLDFLATHPSEIVFVELKSDGFVVRSDKLHDGKVIVLSMIPSEKELANCLEEARKATNDAGRAIVLGSAHDLDSSIGSLISSQKRLLVVDKIHHPNSWPRSDSYSPSLLLSPLLDSSLQITPRTTPTTPPQSSLRSLALTPNPPSPRRRSQEFQHEVVSTSFKRPQPRTSETTSSPPSRPSHPPSLGATDVGTGSPTRPRC